MNVKPGQLARVVSNGETMSTPGILDRIVEVVRAAKPDDTYPSTDGAVRVHWDPSSVNLMDTWVIKSANPLPWKYAIDSDVLWFNERVMPDRNLRPLGGVPIDEEEHNDIKEPV